MTWGLERQSAALGISKSDLAREALKRYLRVAEDGGKTLKNQWSG
jgi:hypothetical protein